MKTQHKGGYLMHLDAGSSGSLPTPYIVSFSPLERPFDMLVSVNKHVILGGYGYEFWLPFIACLVDLLDYQFVILGYA